MKPVDRIMNKVNLPFAQPKRWGISNNSIGYRSHIGNP